MFFLFFRSRMGTIRRFRNTVGPQIRRLRSQRGFTQERLAAKLQVTGLNLDRSTLAKIECRMRPIYDYELIMISAVLQVPMSALFPAIKSIKKMLPDLSGGVSR